MWMSLTCIHTTRDEVNSGALSSLPFTILQEGKLPSECLKEGHCKALQTSFFECKRSMVSVSCIRSQQSTDMSCHVRTASCHCATQSLNTGFIFFLRVPCVEWCNVEKKPIEWSQYRIWNPFIIKGDEQSQMPFFYWSVYFRCIHLRINKCLLSSSARPKVAIPRKKGILTHHS